MSAVRQLMIAALLAFSSLAAMPLAQAQAEPVTDCATDGPDCVVPASSCGAGSGAGSPDPLYNALCGLLTQAKAGGAPVGFVSSPDYDSDGRPDFAEVTTPGGKVRVQMDFFMTRAGDDSPYTFAQWDQESFDVAVTGVMVYRPDNGNRQTPANDAAVYHLTNRYNGEAGHVGLYTVRADNTQTTNGFGVCQVCFEPTNNRLAYSAGPAEDLDGPTPGLLVPTRAGGTSGVVFDFEIDEDSIDETGNDPNGLQTLMLVGYGSRPGNRDLPTLYPDNFPLDFGHLHVKAFPESANAALYFTRVSNLDDDRSTDFQESPCQPSGVFSNPFYGRADCGNYDGDAYENAVDPNPTIPDSILTATLTINGASSREAPFAPKFDLACTGPGTGALMRRTGTGDYVQVMSGVKCGTTFNAPSVSQAGAADTVYNYRVNVLDPLAGNALAPSNAVAVTVQGNAVETVTIRAICLSAAPTCHFNGNQAAATIGSPHSFNGLAYDAYGFPLVDPRVDEDDTYAVQYWVQHDSKNDEQGQRLVCVRVDGGPLPDADSNGNYPDSCRGAFFSGVPVNGVYKVGGHSGTTVTATRNYRHGQALNEKVMDVALDSGGRTAGALSSGAFFVPIPSELDGKPRFFEAGGALTPTQAGAPNPDLSVPTTFRALVFDAGPANRLVGQGETVGPTAFRVEVSYSTAGPSGPFTTFPLSDVRTACASSVVPVVNARLYVPKNPQNCPHGARGGTTLADGSGSVTDTDGYTGNHELFAATRTLPGGQEIRYFYTVTDAAGQTARSPATGSLSFTAGNGAPTVPGVAVPNPVKVIADPACQYGPFSEDFDPSMVPPSSDPDCGSINDVVPTGLPGDANDAWDTDGDNKRSGDANGQNDITEQFFVHLNPDESQPDSDDKFSGTSPNGYTLHTHVDANLLQTRTEDTFVVRVGDVFGTPDFEEVLVIEDNTLHYNVCVGIVDGMPVVYSSDIVTQQLYDAGSAVDGLFTEPLLSYPEGTGYPFNADPEQPCGKPAATQTVESLLTMYDPLTGGPLDPFWVCCYGQYNPEPWFHFVDANGDGVPEQIVMWLPNDDASARSTEPTIIDLGSPAELVDPVVDAVLAVAEEICDPADIDACIPAAPPACDEDLGNLPCVPAVGPPCNPTVPESCIAILDGLCTIAPVPGYCEGPEAIMEELCASDADLAALLAELDLCPEGEPAPDVDGDGVPDADDDCDNTPTGAPIAENGCTDTDRDGVSDNTPDACPNTPAGTEVGDDGCPLPPEEPAGCPEDPAACPADVEALLGEVQTMVADLIEGAPDPFAGLDQCSDVTDPKTHDMGLGPGIFVCVDPSQETVLEKQLASKGIDYPGLLIYVSGVNVWV